MLFFSFFQFLKCYNFQQENFMKLTKTDKEILASYSYMVERLSEYLGAAYEISLHSLEDENHSVIKIMNGYHSGRTIGAPLTDLAMNMLKRINNQGISAASSYTSYNAISGAGEKLRSSTIPVIGDGERVIGMVCINFYMDTPLSEIIQHIEGSNEKISHKEYFAPSMGDAITKAVYEAKASVMNNPAISSVNKNKEIIRILHSKGIFNVKDSVNSVAKALDISRNTVYLHLRGISENEEP